MRHNLLGEIPHDLIPFYYHPLNHHAVPKILNLGGIAKTIFQIFAVFALSAIARIVFEGSQYCVVKLFATSTPRSRLETFSASPCAVIVPFQIVLKSDFQALVFNIFCAGRYLILIQSSFARRFDLFPHIWDLQIFEVIDRASFAGGRVIGPIHEKRYSVIMPDRALYSLCHSANFPIRTALRLYKVVDPFFENG
ncbi:MAG: hypothetical protein H6635_03155 [Anaerolineales bacterium]|nr:hypothetical protein [Anaerolineales bacterium]